MLNLTKPPHTHTQQNSAKKPNAQNLVPGIRTLSCIKTTTLSLKPKFKAYRFTDTHAHTHTYLLTLSREVVTGREEADQGKGPDKLDSVFPGSTKP